MTPAPHKRATDPEDEPPHPRPQDLREVQKWPVLVNLSQLFLLASICIGGTLWYVKWEARDAEIVGQIRALEARMESGYISVEDAVAIQRAALAVLPEPFRDAAARVNVRDVKADEYRRNPNR